MSTTGSQIEQQNESLLLPVNPTNGSSVTLKPVFGDSIFVGSNGRVVALDRATGREVWRNNLPWTGYSIVTLLVAYGKLFVGTNGKLLALRQKDGQIMWTNDLPGLSYEEICLATTDDGTTLTPNRRPAVFVGSHGYVVSVDPQTGAEHWRIRFSLMNLTLVSLMVEGDFLIAGTHGRVYGLELHTGVVRWVNDLPGLGFHHICLSSPRQVGSGANAMAGASPIPQLMNKRDRAERHNPAPSVVAFDTAGTVLVSHL